MSIRTHTADADNVEISTYQNGRDPEFVAVYDEDWDDVTSTILAISDPLNGEAFLLLGTPDEILDFASRLVAAVSRMHPDAYAALVVSDRPIDLSEEGDG